MISYSQILVPVDLGSRTEAIVQHAKAIADRFSSTIEFLYCVANPQFPDATGLLNPYSPDVLERNRVESERELYKLLTPEEWRKYRARATAIIGDPVNEIAAYARSSNADLIVMGTHGRTGLTHMFLGSVAERVIRTAVCPVLTVR